MSLFRHRRAPYPPSRGLPNAVRAVFAVALVLLLGLDGGSAHAAGTRLRANGKWKTFHVRSPGKHQSFLFECQAGAHYRITARPGTLERPRIDLLWGSQSEAAERAGPGLAGKDVVLEWRAEADEVAEIRVRGFSAATGKGKVKLEALDWEGKPTKAGRRYLGAVALDAPFRVGDLLLAESNDWTLVVEPGSSYEVRTSKGTAGGIRLLVVQGKDRIVANSDAWRQAGVHFPTLRFKVPALGPEESPSRWQLRVEGVWSSAGTYGVRMTKLAPEQGVEPEILSPVEDVEPGLVEGQPLTFRLQEGDMAVLWVPEANPNQFRRVQMLLRDRWLYADGRGRDDSAHGDFAAGRRPGRGHFFSFRPFQPGTYRFTGGSGARQGPSTLETLKLYTRAQLGAPPVHMGTNADPTDKARTKTKWQPIGLGICTPGINYIWVARGAPDAGVAMRVRTLDGKTIATRRSVGGAWPTAPGYGPSMRFTVPTPMVVRLEARGGKRIVRALLRELEAQK